MTRRVLILLWALAAIVCFAIVGIAEKQTTDAEQAQYCQMVKEGLWPDYNKSYAKECPGGATHRNGTLTKK